MNRITKKAYRIYKSLTNPISGEMVLSAEADGMIPYQALQEGKYYRGYCRNARVCLWDGQEFWYMRDKFGNFFAESINHPSYVLNKDYQWDIFIPMELASPTEQEIIKHGREQAFRILHRRPSQKNGEDDNN